MAGQRAHRAAPRRRRRRRQRWTERDIEAALAAFLGDRQRWPRRQEFEAAGEHALLGAVYRNGGAEHWARRLGVAWPADRSRAHLHEYGRGSGTTKLAVIRRDETELSQVGLAAL